MKRFTEIPIRTKCSKNRTAPADRRTERAFEPIRQTLDNDEHKVFLLHGVTGSGKQKFICNRLKKYWRKERSHRPRTGNLADAADGQSLQGPFRLSGCSHAQRIIHRGKI